MPLQPTATPSRAGIQAAIDEAVALSADPDNASGPDYDTGWLDLPTTGRNALLGVIVAQYRIYRGMVQFQGRGAFTGNYSINPDGNATDLKICDVPAGVRPGGLGISTWILGEGVSQTGLRFVVYNGGSFNLAGSDARNVTYTYSSGDVWNFMSGLYTINS